MSGAVDFFKIKNFLAPEEIAVRKTAREFVDNEVIPIIKEHFKKGTFPMELIPHVAELRFLGANIPWDEDGPDTNSMGYGLMMQELERGDSGLRSFVSVQSALVMYPIWKFGSEAQKEKWLPLLGQGKVIGCCGVTEPDHGSDPASMETTATPKGGGFVLNKEKTWITNASIADIAIVWARVVPPSDSETIRGFIVEKGTAGFTQNKITDEKYCLRASVTGSLVLDDCWVPEENVLPKTGELKNLLSCFNEARYGIAWGAIGAAAACYETALRYSQTRKQFGKEIGKFQLTQDKLAEMLRKITAMQSLCYLLGRNKDTKRASHNEISLAKWNNTWETIHIALSSISILGAAGTTDAHPAIRHLLNMIAVWIYEGTGEVHKLSIGRNITGFDAFR